MAQTVRSFEEMTTLLGIGDDVIEEFIVGVYSDNENIPDLGALIDTALGKAYLLKKLFIIIFAENKSAFSSESNF